MSDNGSKSEVVYTRVSPEVAGLIAIVMHEQGWNKTRTVEEILRKGLGLDGHLTSPSGRSAVDIAREGALAGCVYALGLLASYARDSNHASGIPAIQQIHAEILEIVQGDAQVLSGADASVIDWEGLRCPS